MSRSRVAACLAFAALIFAAGCSDSSRPQRPGLGLEKYQQDVVQGMPVSLSAAKGLDSASLRVYINKIFNDPSEPGNLVAEAGHLDAMIDVINIGVTADHEPNPESMQTAFEVIPNPDQTLALPFFGESVAIDYLVKMHDSADGAQYAGYKMDADAQTIVVFSTPAPGAGPRDHTLFCGKKENGEVHIWQAIIGVDAGGDWYKAWAYKIRIAGDEGKFEFAQGGSGLFDGEIYSGTMTSAGFARDHFVFRARESSFAHGNLDQANLYDYAGGDFVVVDDVALGEAGDERNGGVLLPGDLPRPESISVADWEAMLAFASIIGDPDDQPGIVPMSLAEFNDSFIRAKFD